MVIKTMSIVTKRICEESARAIFELICAYFGLPQNSGTQLMENENVVLLLKMLKENLLNKPERSCSPEFSGTPKWVVFCEECSNVLLKQLFFEYILCELERSCSPEFSGKPEWVEFCEECADLMKSQQDIGVDRFNCDEFVIKCHELTLINDNLFMDPTLHRCDSGPSC
tara:strand:- start:1748 stop:2254 length:507 start_codon:yes stop_codon:yes gene_type:complete